MRKTTESEANVQKSAVDTAGLMNILSCGRPAAVQIGDEAHARIQIGRRVLWNVDKVNKYLDKISV